MPEPKPWNDDQYNLADDYKIAADEAWQAGWSPDWLEQIGYPGLGPLWRDEPVTTGSVMATLWVATIDQHLCEIYQLDGNQSCDWKVYNTPYLSNNVWSGTGQSLDAAQARCAEVSAAMTRLERPPPPDRATMIAGQQIGYPPSQAPGSQPLPSGVIVQAAPLGLASGLSV